MREKIARFMQGRYGNDELNKFILYLVLLIIIVNLFVKNSVITIIETVILIISILRTFSKNYSARARENQKYLAIRDKILAKFGKKPGNSGYSRNSYSNNAYRQNNASAGYRIFKCPKCKQKIRVPSGKGRIEISCPKCQNKFIKKS